MLICFGGFLEDGRKILAKKFAARMGFHYCNMYEKKFHLYPRTAQGNVQEKILHPFTDTEHLFLYERVIRDFPFLSKAYEHVVVDDSFLRKAPREYFFSKAEDFFKPVIVIWIDGIEPHIEQRVERMHSAGIISDIGNWKKVQERRKASFEPFEFEPPHFIHTLPDENNYAALMLLVEQEAANGAKRIKRRTPAAR